MSVGWFEKHHPLPLFTPATPCLGKKGQVACVSFQWDVGALKLKCLPGVVSWLLAEPSFEPVSPSPGLYRLPVLLGLCGPVILWLLRSGPPGFSHSEGLLPGLS